MRQMLKSIFCDAAFVVGAAAVTCGVTLMFAPAGLVVGGAFCIALGVLVARNGGEDT